MQKTKIEYLDYTWNPLIGCRNWFGGPCGGGSEFKYWAKAMTERFEAHYPFGFDPTFWPRRIAEPVKLRKPSRIGVSFMGDLFGDWLWAKVVGNPDDMMNMDEIREAIIGTARLCPQHTFLFLTKCPWNLRPWNPWPQNAWVGASVTNNGQMTIALQHLSQVKAPVRFISFEPLLGMIGMDDHMPMKGIVEWVITGGKSGKDKFYPPEDWIQEIESAADGAGVAVFEKDNLRKEWPELPRREFPR